MSIPIVMNALAQPNYYISQIRKNTIYFDLPEIVKEDIIDGIILIIAGFGGNANSNVYKKMRRVFADKYNYVMVQCDYFGFEFMQTELLEESLENFCDMGPIQAMDNLIALKCVKDYLEENEIEYDSTNVVAYGHSHGAYLAHLMNTLMPNVLSCIIDNSAWIFPQYVDNYRILNVYCEDDLSEKRLKFEYIISKIIMDRDIYSLEKMYSLIENTTKIVSFHGMADCLISINEKAPFLSQINNSSLEIIGPKRVNEIFKSYNHGLDSDFLKMFDYVVERYITKSDHEVLNFENRTFETNFAAYTIDNSDGIPILYCSSKYDYPFEIFEKI